jgi:hypothetical protein
MYKRTDVAWGRNEDKKADICAKKYLHDGCRDSLIYSTKHFHYILRIFNVMSI